MSRCLRVEMASNESFTVGIIGGKGQLGRWCADIFQRRGSPVLIADRDTELTNLELVAQASIVVVSVPIGVTGAVLREIRDTLRPNQLVVDLTSVKTPFVPIMEGSQGEVLSVHPMFAPSLSAKTGQTCIACDVRGGALAHTFLQVLRDEGLRVVPMTPEVDGICDRAGRGWIRGGVRAGSGEAGSLYDGVSAGAFATRVASLATGDGRPPVVRARDLGGRSPHPSFQGISSG